MADYKKFVRRTSKFLMPKRPIIRSMIALGNCMVDITSQVTQEILDKNGLKFGQTVFSNEKNMAYFDELEKNPKVTYTAGGSIENSLRVLSWVLNMKQFNSITITMLGAVGNDTYKDIIVNKLKEDNVIPLFEIIPDKGTSRCAVGVLDKERCLLSDIRASSLLSDDFIQKNQMEIFGCDALLIEGYYLLSNFDMCKNLCDKFAKDGKTVILTFGAVFIIENLYDKLLDLCNSADMIFCNLEEAEALAKEKDKPLEDIFCSIHKKLSEKIRTLIVTAGSKGVYCSEYNYKKNHLDFMTHVYPDLLSKEEICDLNGAGDSFLGGFVAQYLMGGSIVACCKTGNQASNVIIHNVGCTFPKDVKFNFEELEHS